MEKIIVNQYNPQWVSQFESLHNAIWPHISDIALTLEHVGSTSVPGLVAKPIIDLTIVVPEEGCMPIIINRLASIGIKHRGNLGIIGREAFTRLQGYPEHNLYACISGSQPLRNHIAIRDALRNNTKLAKKYGELKLLLASKYKNDIDSYVEGKSSFLLSILEECGFSNEDIYEIENINHKPQKGSNNAN